MRRVHLVVLATAVLIVAAGCGARAVPSTAAEPTLGPRPDVVLVRGSIETAEPAAFTVRTPSGLQRVELDEMSGFGVLTATGLDTIAKGEFVGVTSQRRPGGGFEAVEVHIFPESQRGSGEGHYPWDLPRPGGATTMTNATIADVVQEVDGRVLILAPQGQTVQITVPPTAPVVRINISAAADVLRPGNGAVVVTRKAPDGRLVVLRAFTGEGGAMPAI